MIVNSEESDLQPFSRVADHEGSIEIIEAPPRNHLTEATISEKYIGLLLFFHIGQGSQAIGDAILSSSTIPRVSLSIDGGCTHNSQLETQLLFSRTKQVEA